MKEKKKKNYLSLLIGIKTNNRGLTLAEILIVSLIISVLFGILFSVLNLGQVSQKVSLERIYLESELRRLMDWISQDVRQSTAYRINENNSTPEEIKFKKVIGADTSQINNPLLFSENYTQYLYYTNGSMERRIINESDGATKSWFFDTGLVQAPFYTYNATTDEIVPLNGHDLMASAKLIVNLTAQKIVRNKILDCQLTQEIAIRNNE